jgi:hypothetical protein
VVLGGGVDRDAVVSARLHQMAHQQPQRARPEAAAPVRGAQEDVESGVPVVGLGPGLRQIQPLRRNQNSRPDAVPAISRIVNSTDQIPWSAKKSPSTFMP